MKTFMIVLTVFGIFEMLSNLFHLSRGNKTAIGESAKKQHQELPLDIELHNFYYKAIIMFIIGILFSLSSIIYLIFNNDLGILFTFINSIILSCYGLVQIFIYYRTIKVWTSFLVYSIPLITYFIIK